MITASPESLATTSRISSTTRVDFDRYAGLCCASSCRLASLAAVAGIGDVDAIADDVGGRSFPLDLGGRLMLPALCHKASGIVETVTDLFFNCILLAELPW